MEHNDVHMSSGSGHYTSCAVASDLNEHRGRYFA